MAPTGVRRRELYILGLLQFVHIIAVSAQVPVRGQTTILEEAIFRVFAPFQKMTTGALHGVSGFYRGYIGLRQARVESDQLRKELSRVRGELQRRQSDIAEVERLRQLLELRQSLPYHTETARVIGSDALNPTKTLFLDKGSRHGVRHNCPVISAEGYLVGRTITPIAPAESTVQLITDSEAGVGAMLAGSRAYAVASGTGDRRCQLRHVPSFITVASGEEVLTSGLDQIYPRGILIGRVLSGSPAGSTLSELVVQPAMDLYRIDYVLILTGGSVSTEIHSGAGGP